MADPQASLRPAWRVSNGMTRELILADDRMRELFVEFIGRSVYDQIRAG